MNVPQEQVRTERPREQFRKFSTYPRQPAHNPHTQTPSSAKLDKRLSSEAKQNVEQAAAAQTRNRPVGQIILGVTTEVV